MRALTFILLLILLLAKPGLAQKIAVELGQSPLPLNQYFTVSVRLQNQQLKDYTPFPDIEGFKKSNKYSSTKTIITGGTTTTILTITQNYAALQEGAYTLKPFTMKINGQTLQSEGMKIEVTEMQDDVAQNPNLPPGLMVPEEEQVQPEAQEVEFVDTEDDAFLTLYLDKEEVFVGEGLNAALYFYLPEKNQRLLDFYDFADQINGIMQDLKQAHAWEEMFEYTEITPENVTVQGEPYLRFKLYEAVLYPIMAKPLTFPQLHLRMIKYKVAKNPTLLAEDRQEGYKTFYSRPREVAVKELPPHPLRDVVPVGDYRLQEYLSEETVPVNKSFRYVFEVEGEGNLAAIMQPKPTAPAGLELYPPDVQQDVTKRAGTVSGSKSFTFDVLPREPGHYSMGEVVQWVFFNPVTAAYDTLRPSLQVQVTGARDSDALVLSRDLGSFYNIIKNEDNTLVSLHLFDQVKRYTNIVLLVLLAVAAFVFIKK
ncbi:BatD family protein [Pontibacter mangrovi]|uniref:Protein BatD n=1 Tax=Pontibacter mangrovi TaxID=2589816 RepID=A0A501WCZ7_9BACT|nr:BatD family protein [Pontibacter mangrovi]TPE44737.1 protein BatD [Pontibacter mangrovi]